MRYECVLSRNTDTKTAAGFLSTRDAGRKNREVLREKDKKEEKKKTEREREREKEKGKRRKKRKKFFHVTTPDYNVARVSRVVNGRVFKIN